PPHGRRPASRGSGRAVRSLSLSVLPRGPALASGPEMTAPPLVEHSSEQSTPPQAGLAVPPVGSGPMSPPAPLHRRSARARRAAGTGEGGAGDDHCGLGAG